MEVFDRLKSIVLLLFCAHLGMHCQNPPKIQNSSNLSKPLSTSAPTSPDLEKSPDNTPSTEENPAPERFVEPKKIPGDAPEDEIPTRFLPIVVKDPAPAITPATKPKRRITPTPKAPVYIDPNKINQQHNHVENTFAKVYQTYILVGTNQKERWHGIEKAFEEHFQTIKTNFEHHANIQYQWAGVEYWSPNIDENHPQAQSLFFEALSAYVEAKKTSNQDAFYVGVHFLKSGETNILHRTKMFENYIMTSIHGEKSKCFGSILINAVSHEIGHTLGLPHAEVENDFMLPYQEYESCVTRDFFFPSTEVFPILQKTYQNGEGYRVPEKESLLAFVDDLDIEAYPRFIAENYYQLYAYMNPQIRAEQCELLTKSKNILTAKIEAIKQAYAQVNDQGKKTIVASSINHAIDIEAYLKSQKRSIDAYNARCLQP